MRLLSQRAFEITSGIEAALDRARKVAVEGGRESICVIGGGEIYRLALPHADCVHLTHVESEPEGDTHFPALDPAKWGVESREIGPGRRKRQRVDRICGLSS